MPNTPKKKLKTSLAGKKTKSSSKSAQHKDHHPRSGTQPPIQFDFIWKDFVKIELDGRNLKIRGYLTDVGYQIVIEEQDIEVASFWFATLSKEQLAFFKKNDINYTNLSVLPVEVKNELVRP